MGEQKRRPILSVLSQYWLLGLMLTLAISAILFGVALLSRPPVPPIRSLRVLSDIPLPGGSSRLDYQSIDPQTHRLFIAHLGASVVSVVDLSSNTVIATIPDLAGVHGVLAVPELGRLYASATADNQVAVIDEPTLRVIARIPAGEYPDGIAYDPIQHHLFVSDETGQTDTVIDATTNQRLATIPLGGEVGNTQYDPVSHEIFVDVL